MMTFPFDERLITLTLEEAEQLRDCLEHEYISHDRFPLVIDLLRRINFALDNTEHELLDRVDG